MIDDKEIADLLTRALAEWEDSGGRTIRVYTIEQIKALPPFKDIELPGLEGAEL